MKPIRIVHVIASLAARDGGPSQACRDMAQGLAALGHEVAVYATDRNAAAGTLADGLPRSEGGVEYRTYPVHAPRGWGTSLQLARALDVRIRSTDIVHVHSLYLFHSFVAPLLCRRHGVPYVVRPHGSLDPYILARHRWRRLPFELLFQRRSLRLADAVHYTSADERQLAEASGAAGPPLVVPLAVPWQDYAGIPRPAPPGPRTVLFLGRLHAKKGLDMLLPAFARATAARNDLQLVVAGPDDGALGDAQRLAQALGIAGRVTFPGMLTGPAKRAALAGATLFVLPSRSENFALAAAEAMAAGVPVLVSDRVAIWREIVAAACGCAVPCDATALAGAMSAMLDDPGLAAMGGRGRQLARDMFDPGVVARQLESGYRTILERRARSLAA